MQRLLDFAAGKVTGAPSGQGPGFFSKQKEYEIEGRRYVEEHPISEGGFSFVVKVRDLEDGETYALKKILCQDEESFVLAQAEVEILENLPKHKNIVGYFGHAIDERHAKGRREVLLLLELCPRGHLLDYLNRYKGKIPEAKLLKAFLDVAEAIFCLHSHSPPIQHRDLKLENVLRGRDGFWKVVDFGSWSNTPIDLSALPAKQLTAIGEELERHTTMMYRPPEVVDIHLRFPISCAVDIWMLGCVLYTLMYNRHPFQDETSLAIRNVNFKLPPRKPAFSTKLVDLLIWLMAQDPRHRPSARKLVTTLWQWDDFSNLELPGPALELKQKLLSKSSAFQPRSRENGRAGASVPLVAPAKLAAPPLSSASVLAVDAVSTPWVAFDNAVPATEQVSSETTSAVLPDSGQEDWAFDGFQCADPEAPAAADVSGFEHASSTTAIDSRATMLAEAANAALADAASSASTEAANATVTAEVGFAASAEAASATAVETGIATSAEAARTVPAEASSIDTASAAVAAGSTAASTEARVDVSAVSDTAAGAQADLAADAEADTAASTEEDSATLAGATTACSAEASIAAPAQTDSANSPEASLAYPTQADAVAEAAGAASVGADTVAITEAALSSATDADMIASGEAAVITSCEASIQADSATAGETDTASNAEAAISVATASEAQSVGCHEVAPALAAEADSAEAAVAAASESHRAGCVEASVMAAAEEDTLASAEAAAFTAAAEADSAASAETAVSSAADTETAAGAGAAGAPAADSADSAAHIDPAVAALAVAHTAANAVIGADCAKLEPQEQLQEEL